jgi:outer membrane protein assembly factor BamB
MRSLLNLLMACTVAMAAVSCSPSSAPAPQAAARLPQAPLPTAQTLAKANLQYYWKMERKDLALQEGESISIVYKLDENLYAVTNHDRLICIDKDRGLLKWSYPIRTYGERIFRPSETAKEVTLSRRPPSTTQIANKTTYDEPTKFHLVVVSTTTHLFVLDRDNGDLIRDIKLPFAAATGTATDGPYAFIATAEGNYCAILMDEAAPIWSLGTNSSINVSPVVGAGLVFVGGTDGVIRTARITRESHPEWHANLGSPINGPLTVSDKVCLVPCDDYRLYAFQPTTGAPLWKQPFIARDAIHDPPQLGESTVFQYVRGDKFYAINLASGMKRWESPTAMAVLALRMDKTDNNVYLLGKGNNLEVADEVLGAVKEKLPLSGLDLYVANTNSPAIYVGNHNGFLACIRLLSAGYIKPSDLPPAPVK